jgi:hypothetical protein
MREEGYYFVKIHNKWVIGWYFPEDTCWNFVGSSDYVDLDFQEIGQKIELPKD